MAGRGSRSCLCQRAAGHRPAQGCWSAMHPRRPAVRVGAGVPRCWGRTSRRRPCRSRCSRRPSDRRRCTRCRWRRGPRSPPSPRSYWPARCRPGTRPWDSLGPLLRASRQVPASPARCRFRADLLDHEHHGSFPRDCAALLPSVPTHARRCLVRPGLRLEYVYVPNPILIDQILYRLGLHVVLKPTPTPTSAPTPPGLS